LHQSTASEKIEINCDSSSTAENVPTNTLFKRKNGERDCCSDDENDNSETSSLLSRVDPLEPGYEPIGGETMMESLMSMIAVQSSMLAVSLYYSLFNLLFFFTQV